MRAWLALVPSLAIAWSLARLLPFPDMAFAVAAGLALSLALSLTAAAAAASAGATPILAVVGLAGGALGLACLARVRRGRGPQLPAPTVPALVAAAVTLIQATLLASVPAFGWDFRYEWGLKASLPFGGLADWSLLAWPPASFVHPDYPPLWNALLWVGQGLGASVQQAAAAWLAVLCLGLAAACWAAARRSGAWTAALAASVGALAPVIWVRSVEHSGYAEGVLAFLAAVTFACLPRLRRGDSGAILVLGAAVGLLGLAKNEGTVLALAVALAAVTVSRRRQTLAVLPAAVVPALLWRWLVALEGVAPGHIGSHPFERLAALPGAVAAALTPSLGLLLLAWGLVAGSLLLRKRAGIGTALSLWALGVLAAYALLPDELRWLVSTSFDRVIAAPLPAAIAASLSTDSEEPTPGGAAAQ